MSQGGFMQNMFWAFYDSEGFIVKNDWNGNQRIGVPLGKYANMEKAANTAIEKAKEYRKMLEDYGHLQKELTPEERFAAISQQLQMLTGIVEQQSQIINSLTKESGKVVVPEVIPPEKQGTQTAGGSNGGVANNSGSSAGFIASK